MPAAEAGETSGLNSFRPRPTNPESTVTFDILTGRESLHQLTNDETIVQTNDSKLKRMTSTATNLLSVLVILLISHLKAQEYEGEDHENVEYDGEEESEYDHPDYSKYYSVDEAAPAPLAAAEGGDTQGGGELAFYANPVEFGESKKQQVQAVLPTTFVPRDQAAEVFPNFASSSKQFSYFPANVGLKDYFEEAQKKEQVAKQNKVNEKYVRPGPSYISQHVPHRLDFADEDKAESADDVERIPPRKNKPKTDFSNTDDAEYDSEEKDKEYKIPGYEAPFLKNSKPKINYDIGKSSSSVSQYPSAAGIRSSSSLSPYQKYSFQPVTETASSLDPKLFDSISSTITPYNPSYKKISEPIETQPSEDSPSNLNKKCRRIESPSSSDKMNCFVCEDETHKSKYTQCSYAAAQEPVGYYSGNSERYSVPAPAPHHLRYKRYAKKSRSDAYDSIRERSRKAFSEPTIPEDYNYGFYYSPEGYDESRSELSYSEAQSEELKKNPENCKKVEKKGVTCTVCHNPKTGGNFESCSYTSEPSEKKYAYVTEKKYDSDDPEETKVTTKTQKPDGKIEIKEGIEKSAETKEAEPTESYESQIPQDSSKPPRKRLEEGSLFENSGELTKSDESKDIYHKVNSPKSKTVDSEETRDIYHHLDHIDDNPKQEKQKLVNDEHYDVPSHFAESITGGQPDETKDESSEFDEYHFKLFPELKKENSEAEEESKEEEEEYHIPEATKQNVEEVLAEFTKKDRSTCKKAEKNGMTCYLCVDSNNIQHEECMYVQESRPQSKHVAYHEVKGLKNKENTPEESKQQPLVVSTPAALPLISTLSAAPTTFSLEAAASEEIKTTVPYKPKKKIIKKKRSPKKAKKAGKKTETVEPTLKTPAEIDVGAEEGAYSAETKPVYSKLHGVQLPRYMLEKSEFEKEFDEFAGGF